MGNFQIRILKRTFWFAATWYRQACVMCHEIYDSIFYGLVKVATAA